MSKKVSLHVYDLSQGLARQLSQQLIGRHFDGIYHTGIVVFGREYFFGGGIFDAAPSTTPYGTPTEIIELGETQRTESEFNSFLSSSLRLRFTMQSYHLLDNNCNHFTEQCALFLVGQSIPDRIKNLPQEFLQTPMGQMIRPMIDQLMGAVNPSNMATTAPSEMPPMGEFGGGSGGFGGVDTNMLSSMTGMSPDMIQNIMSSPMAQQMMSDMANGNLDMSALMNQAGGGGIGNLGGFNPLFGTTAGGQAWPQQQQQQQTTSYTDDKSIIRYQKSNVPQVIKKLKDTIAEDKVELHAEDDKYIDNLQQFLLHDKNNLSLITHGTVRMIARLMAQLPEAKIFPVLDLLRLLILSPAVAGMCIANETDSPLVVIEREFLTKWDSLTMPTQLMILRTYCNLFNSQYTDGDQGALYMIYQSPERFSQIADMITSSLSSKLEPIRLTGASLASNLALYIPRSGSDEEIQLLSSMIEFLGNETSDEVLFRMLLTMYRMIQGAPGDTIEVIKALELDKALDKIPKSQRVHPLVQAVKRELGL